MRLHQKIVIILTVGLGSSLILWFNLSYLVSKSDFVRCMRLLFPIVHFCLVSLLVLRGNRIFVLFKREKTTGSPHTLNIARLVGIIALGAAYVIMFILCLGR